MDLLTKLAKEAPRWPHTMPDGNLNDRDSILRSLRTAIPIHVQNVADYLYLETEQYDFYLNRDFPNIAPPWPVFFMSFKMPPRLRRKDGWERNLSAGLEHSYLFVGERNEATGGWIVKSRLFISTTTEMIITQGAKWCVSKDGECLSAEGKPLEGETTSYSVTPILRWPEGNVLARGYFEPSLFFVPFLAICFCHCKNVDILKEPVAPKVKAKRERSYGWTPDAWHTLKIEPIRKQLADAGAHQPAGLKRALHIMRGHFKDYRDGRGLFGKHHGMWWWDFQLTHSSHKHRYDIEPQ
jgi:hypothetical protein